jgi:hypothetical protein
MVVITNNKDKNLSYKVIQFNYDGDGTALVIMDDGKSVGTLDKSTLEDYILGAKGKEKEWTVSVED